MKLAQFMVFLLIIAAAYAAYENRQSVYDFAAGSRVRTLSPTNQILSVKTISEIDSLVSKSDLIIGMQVTIVDFQKNARYVIYTSIDNSDLRLIYLNQLNSNDINSPLFNADLMNNHLLVALINGDFVCSPFTDTLESKLKPGTSKYIHTVCSNGIPPYYGRFSGIISIYTKRVPLPEEADQIRMLAKNLSSIIYDRDFK